MTKRIIISYLGALGLPLLLLPVAAIKSISFYPLMFLIVLLSPPIGLIAALSYSDAKRQFDAESIGLRSTISFLMYASIFVLFMAISEMDVSPFLKNQGWIMILLCGPFVAAVTSEQIMKRRESTKAIDDSGKIKKNNSIIDNKNTRWDSKKKPWLVAAGAYFAVLFIYYLITNLPHSEILQSLMKKNASLNTEGSSGTTVAAQRQVESNGFYDQYPFSPQVIQSIWIDLDKAYQDEGVGIYSVYRGLRNLISYKKLGEWANMQVFIKGPHTQERLNVSSKNDFGYYNKDFVVWMRNTLIPAANDSAFRDKTQRLYNLCLRETARSYYIEYIKMKAQPGLVESTKKEYLAAMAVNSPYFPKFENADVAIVPDDPDYSSGSGSDPEKVPHKHPKLSSYEVRRTFLFWLRRSLDGTDAEFANGLEKLLQVYDPDFLTAVRSKAR